MQAREGLPLYDLYEYLAVKILPHIQWNGVLKSFFSYKEKKECLIRVLLQKLDKG
jgi:hypothetical protein